MNQMINTITIDIKKRKMKTKWIDSILKIIYFIKLTFCIALHDLTKASSCSLRSIFAFTSKTLKSLVGSILQHHRCNLSQRLLALFRWGSFYLSLWENNFSRQLEGLYLRFIVRFKKANGCTVWWPSSSEVKFKLIVLAQGHSRYSLTVK